MSQLVLERIEGGTLTHVRGNGAPAAVDSLATKPPATLFQYNSAGQSDFVATLGQTEFLIYSRESDSAEAELQSSANDQTYLFPRDDHIFSLDGDDWQGLLLQVCSMDFSEVKPGEFIMASMAGVSTWFRIPSEEGEPLIFGCDPSYGHYLFHTMAEVVSDCGGVKN